MTSHTCFVILALSAATASFAQSSANDTDEIPSVTVNYSDLNLATEKGSRELYGRLVTAAHQVCPDKAETLMAINQNLQAQRCVTQAVDRAVKEIRSPKFAEVAADSHLR